jgi:deoxyxylulose-5-phosphate synthase
MKYDNFKKLIRNLRKAKYEKIRIARNVSNFSSREESKKDIISSEHNNNIGRE